VPDHLDDDDDGDGILDADENSGILWFENWMTRLFC
jgi:hypothetical protein